MYGRNSLLKFNLGSPIFNSETLENRFNHIDEIITKKKQTVCQRLVIKFNWKICKIYGKYKKSPLLKIVFLPKILS